MKKQEYVEYVEKRAKRSPILKNCFFAFVIGGAICTLGQAFLDLYKHLGVNEDDAGTLTSITLIFTSCLLTGLGIFDNIARVAGAGTLVPITGFANAVSSQAIDTKSEGYVLGVGAKIFTIAGPVILYAILSGTLYGVIYYVCTLIWG
ncbi:MAG: stage V sporulation protein AC [Clostridia bacterium]|nr:stage V sporulation protein AC [Clostridia bacterium]